MERCDFASIMKIIRTGLLDGNFGSQAELIDTMFSSYLQSNNVSFDMGLLNKWLNGLARVSPAVGLFYLKDRKNRNELAITIEDVILPCLSDSSMTVQNVYNLLIQDPTISERKKQELSHGGTFHTDSDEAAFLADTLVFGMTRPFQARDIRKPRSVNLTIKSPDVREYILDGEVPEPCEFFCGREEEIFIIHKALVWYGKLFIEGTPGIGKSEVAKGYAKAYKQDYTNILYILYSGDLQRDIANMYFIDDIPQETEKERFNRHDRFLRTLKEDTLLIIDNFDTKSSKETSLLNLWKYRCHILITTRCRWVGYRRYRIGIIKDDETLFQLMAHYYPDAEKNKDIMLRIMKEVQWNTLLVELIARFLGQEKSNLETVLFQLRSMGAKISAKEKVRMNKDGKVRCETIYAHIQTMLELSELSAVQQNIMRNMALVPSFGIPKHLLAKWMHFIDMNQIEELIDLGYLFCNRDNRVSLPRIIQRAAFSELSPSAGDCKAFLESIRHECLSHEKESSDYLLIIGIIEALMKTPKDDFAFYLQFLQDTYPYVEKYDYQDTMEDMRGEMNLMMMAIPPSKMDEALTQYYYARTVEDPIERIPELESALSMLEITTKETALLAKNIHGELASAYHVFEKNDIAEQHMTAALDLWANCQPIYDDGAHFFYCKDAILQLFNHVILLGGMEEYEMALCEILGLQELLEELNPDSFDYGLFLQLKAELQIYEVDIDEKESAVQNLQRAYQIFRSVLQYDNDLLTKKEQRIMELLQAAGLTSEDIQKLLKTTDT